MRQMITVAAALVVAMPSTAQVMATSTTVDSAAATADFITVPANTEIWLSPSSEISSKQLRTGDTFPLIVSRDVFVDRIRVIPRGATATAKVGYRTGKGAFGKSAKMEFDLISLEVAHRPVALSGHYRINGSGNSAATVFVVLFVSAVGGALVTGHSATLPAGSEWRATTVAPLQIAFEDVVPAVGGSTLAARRIETPPATMVPAVVRTDAVPAVAVAVAAPVRFVAPRAPVTYAPPRPMSSVPNYPPNSAYEPAPAEILIRTLPPRP